MWVFAKTNKKPVQYDSQKLKKSNKSKELKKIFLVSLRENKNTTTIPPIYVYYLYKSHPILWNFCFWKIPSLKKIPFLLTIPTTTNIVVPYLKKHKTIQIFFWKKYSNVKSVLIWSPFCFFSCFNITILKYTILQNYKKKSIRVSLFCPVNYFS